MDNYPKLSALLNRVHQEKSTNKAETLLKILKKEHHWPYVQLKYFNNKSSLVMLHNIYKQDIPIVDTELYDECRSVILDMNAPDGSNIVLSLSKKIPQKTTIDMVNNLQETPRYIESGYEGTMIYMYYYNDKWYISTSTCPSIDRSRYFNPTKTHGNMLDEALTDMFPDMVFEENETRIEKSKKLREKFYSYLDTSNTYSFILVHHENGYIMNYSSTLGDNYAKLFHINTRNKVTMESNIDINPSLKSIGVLYTERYESIDTAITTLKNDPSLYAIMTHMNNGDIYRVSTNEIIRKEEDNLGHPNPWMNLLWVYMQNKPHIRMEHYLKNHPEVNEQLDASTSHGVIIAPTRVIAKVMTSIRDILYTMYRSTTYYFKNTNTYKINKEYDQQLSPIFRFHLAQLRHIQTNFHTDSPLSRKTIHHYICHHQTMKNIRLLIESITNTPVYSFDQETSDCFYILNKNLKNNR